ncbi:MAG: 50S ribosomal protein L17 [Pyrinomonadaceae bacterium]|nr:50S ribosomal protein L17 [Pyrinomonadaceae bacterium]MCX7639354.1 50S ribosomal protein L17 [Pyrinomonadaceae bacterium]MDW8305230.1 50S ribosomal protein L17 [Acidobacteriota bacterium]
MRHLKAHRKLGRKTEHRISMLRNLATSLINSKKEYIITTVPKAKELRSFVEKAINLARKAQNLSGEDAAVKRLHLRRLAAKYFHAGNHEYKQKMSVYRGKKGEAKERPERTAGVKALKRLFEELGPRYKDRNGGYTRIIRLGKNRKGDGAELALIELVDNPREKEQNS